MRTSTSTNHGTTPEGWQTVHDYGETFAVVIDLPKDRQFPFQGQYVKYLAQAEQLIVVWYRAYQGTWKLNGNYSMETRIKGRRIKKDGTLSDTQETTQQILTWTPWEKGQERRIVFVGAAEALRDLIDATKALLPE